MLLKKKIGKAQQGGIFAPAQIDFGARDFSQLLKYYDQTGRRSSRASRPSGGTKKKESSPEGLPSDISYYNNKVQQLTAEIEEGLMTDGYENTPEYKAKEQELYRLKATVKPSHKHNKEQFDSNVKNITNKGAYDTPAIYNRMVLVEDRATPGSFGVVSEDAVLKSAGQFRILDLGEAEDLRAHKFAGDTPTGQFLDKMLLRSYGSNQFNEFIKSNTTGFTEKDGILRNGADEINLDNIIPGGIGLGVHIKTNAPQLSSMADEVKYGDSPVSNYADAVAFKQLYNSISDDGTLAIDEDGVEQKLNIDNMTRQDVLNVINKKKSAFVDNSVYKHLKQAVKYDVKKDTSTSKSDSGDLKYANEFMTARVQLGHPGNQKSVEVLTGVPNKTLGYTLNWSLVPGLTGYVENFYQSPSGKDSDREDSDKIVGKQSLAVNGMLETAAGNDLSGTLTLGDGTKVSSITPDGNLNAATLIPEKQMSLSIAPMSKGPDGKWVVNFAHPYAKAVAQVVNEQAARLIELEKQATDMSASEYKDALRDLMADINKRASQALGSAGVADNIPDLKYGYALGMDILISSKAENPYLSKNVSETDESRLEYRTGYSKRVKKAKAFLPLDVAFLTRMSAPNAMGDPLKYRSGEEYKEAVQNKTDMPYSGEAAVRSVSGSYFQMYKDGGKMPDDDDFMNMIF